VGRSLAEGCRVGAGGGWLGAVSGLGGC
jgi:hypothetical protein